MSELTINKTIKQVDVTVTQLNRVVEIQSERIINKINLNYIYPVGPQGDSWQETFETVSKNLKGYPYTLNYTSGKLTSIVYTLPTGTITKTLSYTGTKLTSIALSGAVPSGINLTKTLSYTGNTLSAITYS